MRFCDAHNHLQDDRWPDTLAERLASGRHVGVARMVVNGTHESDWDAVARAADQFPDEIIPSFGLHPWFVPERSPDWLSILRTFIERYPGAGVGEIGLDRWKEGLAEKEQEEVFLQQLQLATEFDRPVSIHCLQAWGRLVEIVESERLPTRGFLLHSYGGSAELVARLARCGAYFSFPGAFAREKKTRQREAFRQVPPDRLLVETDAPDQLPPRHLQAVKVEDAEGRPLNHPANLPAIYEVLAELREAPLDQLVPQVEQNFRRFFKSTAQ